MSLKVQFIAYNVSIPFSYDHSIAFFQIPDFNQPAILKTEILLKSPATEIIDPFFNLNFFVLMDIQGSARMMQNVAHYFGPSIDGSRFAAKRIDPAFMVAQLNQIPSAFHTQGSGCSPPSERTRISNKAIVSGRILGLRKEY